MDGYMNESLDLNVSLERNRANDDVNKPSISEVNDSKLKKRKSKIPFLSNNKETEFIKYPSPRRTSEENVNQLKSRRKSSPSECADSQQIPINEVSPSRKSKESNSQNENKELEAGSTLTPKRSRKSLSRKDHIYQSELEVLAGLPDITSNVK
ncbi:hypothetical protein OTU49_016203 [Cherax quadricarinatus]|uniref:Uncharacterized protein n=1 Tax=Cherax quadricarinatus TaxID=27406 RepID=A0AAW0XXZ4_CHEQU